MEKTSPSVGLERTQGGETEGSIGAQARKGGEVSQKAVFEALSLGGVVSLSLGEVVRLRAAFEKAWQAQKRDDATVKISWILEEVKDKIRKKK